MGVERGLVPLAKRGRRQGGLEETNVTLGFDCQSQIKVVLEMGQLDIVMLWEKGREV